VTLRAPARVCTWLRFVNERDEIGRTIDEAMERRIFYVTH